MRKDYLIKKVCVYYFSQLEIIIIYLKISLNNFLLILWKEKTDNSFHILYFFFFKESCDFFQIKLIFLLSGCL